MTMSSLKIPNITCHHCVRSIKSELEDLEGVVGVDGDPATKTITVQWEAPATLDEIKKTLTEINYPAQ